MPMNCEGMTVTVGAINETAAYTVRKMTLKVVTVCAIAKQLSKRDASLVF